ncbi:hypothetical protein CKF54_04580 [Psittacicella hinzii]|uniref:Lysine exporter LysO family protein n=1 Tax=Psittacicella hinzii TaxID=2028575 RepID=A0A3A1Y5A5_9GAMM|nr:lysine exporter LysO family protein [Psittacicella hinzii]RIY32550.1 hypothetical protein CKF54_04580 [Psittacicella hinzii]
MDILLGLSIVLAPIFIGYYLGTIFTQIGKYLGKLLTIVLCILLFIMGFKLALIDDLLVKLPKVAFDLTVIVVILSLCNILLLIPYDKLKNKSAHFHQIKVNYLHLFFDISKLILSVIAGVVVGAIYVYFDYSIDHHLLGIYSNIALLLLIFIVGLELGGAKYRLRDVFLNKEAIIISLLFTFSCLVAGVIVSFVLNMNVWRSLAYTSGMGWYSLSSVIVTNAYSPLEGSLMFFIDIAREILALFLVPILMKNYRCTAVTFPGATSLDSSLPIIQKSGGNGVVGLAISFGFLANLYVPVLMVLFTNLSK